MNIAATREISAFGDATVELGGELVFLDKMEKKTREKKRKKKRINGKK